MVLSLGVLPYLGLVSYDLWLHESARRVPKVEQVLHALLIVGLGGFIVTAIAGHAAIAGACLAVSLPLAVADELGFHRHLDRHERRLHLAEGAALVFFTALWLASEMVAWTG